MKNFIFAAAMLTVPSVASAASVSYVGLADGLPGSSPMSVSVTENTSGIDVDFSWETVPEEGRSAAIEFQSMGGFDIFFTGYTDLSIYQDLDRLLVSGGVLEKINGNGDAIKTFEFNASGDFCGFAGPDCLIVSGPGAYKVGNTQFDGLIDIALLPDASTPIISVQEGGFFRFTAAESNNPPAGFMSFTIAGIDTAVSEVPLPAGLPLLLAGLGLLATRKKRS